MGNPITWQNVTGPNQSGALQALENAQRTITGAFDPFAKMIQQREATDAANVLTGQNNAQQSYLNLLGGAKTQEDLIALRNSGEIDRRFATLDPRSQGLVRNAEEARMATVQQQATTNLAFNNAAIDERTRGIEQTLKAELLNPNADPVKIAAYKEQYAIAGGRNQAAVAEYADKFAQTAVDRTRATADFVNREAKFKQDVLVSNDALATHATQRDAAAETLAAAKENRVIAAAQLEAARKAAVSAANKQALVDQGNMYASDGIYTGKQSGDLMEMLTKNKIGDTTEERTAILEKFASGTVEIDSPDGKSKIKVPIPYAKLKEAVLSSKDELFSWNGGWASSAEKTLKKALESTYTAKGADGVTDVLKSNAAEDLAAFNQTISNARNNPPMVGNPKKNPYATIGGAPKK